MGTWSRYLRPCGYLPLGIDVCSYVGAFLFGTWSLIWDHMREEEFHAIRLDLLQIYTTYLYRICIVLSFSNSFDQNGFHTNPKHLVGHSYVIFEGDRSPPVYLNIPIFGCISLYFGVVLVVLILGLGCDCFLYIGAIGCAYSVLGTSIWLIDNDQWCLYVWCSRIDNHQCDAFR